MQSKLKIDFPVFLENRGCVENYDDDIVVAAYSLVFDKETPCSTLVVCKVKCVLVRIVSYCKSEVLLSEVSVSLHNLKNTKCVT